MNCLSSTCRVHCCLVITPLTQLPMSSLTQHEAPPQCAGCRINKCHNASSVMMTTLMLSYNVIMPAIFVSRSKTGKDEPLESVNQADQAATECRSFRQEGEKLTHYVSHHFHYNQCNNSYRIPSWLAVKVHEESCMEAHKAKANVYGICIGIP